MESPTTAQTQVILGRMKENVSGDVSLKSTAMSASSLSAMSFEPPPGCQSLRDVVKKADVAEPNYVSSASSIGTRDSDAGAMSDADSIAPNGRLPPSRLDRGTSDLLNAKVTQRQTSRQGRSSQRWITESNQTIRLVTGCVPILKGGKIMFVSASRKPEWILPKGGWEMDEAMEESAVRECFEEAGVLGVLGPKLKQVEYETRKAKKRRLEQEDFERNCRVKAQQNSTAQQQSSTEGGASAVSSPETDKERSSPQNEAPLTEESLNRIRQESTVSGYQSEGKASTSSSSTYSKVRMTLFPLYVSQVLEKWPEDGRFRKAVDIDEAIGMLDTRPELKEVLEEVKSRGLHKMAESYASSSRQTPL
mmetsp:Transcript_19313/g.41554  ORF Transcript_19313/g.41554 Transcript_19313/m.41554 type:complete len:363 (-) Transcript_19313:81-1169(-)|eukprot:CAMPEP_0168749690 /NCGR_PEP_ID=MMETSP0724-20121128/16852_1 /TAXON_ID=265536 /ORGANISM="Amphiprora sp., Strain CCMP467" /LENGTH=362 /DNA_ID=CAMNT_0008797619 /DNA_START=290 /DNA_END=1378 /DNA_ORIENTATION=-